MTANVSRPRWCASLLLAFAGCAEGPPTNEPAIPGIVAGSAGVSTISAGGAGNGGVSGSASSAGSGNDSAGSSTALGGGGMAGGGVGVSGLGGTAVGGAPASGLCNAGNCSEFTSNFDGFLFEYPCAAGGCSGLMCVANALTITQAFQVKGDPASVYRIDFRVRGITESKNYTGGKRRSSAPIDPGAAGGDLWYEGGTAPVSSYSSYELHITPPVAGGPNDYFLNARDGTDEHDGTTWALNYLASVKVNGGGTITFKTFDSNCSAIRNCGPKGTNPCTPRTLDLSDAVPPVAVIQPIRDANSTAPQWLHIDVLSVEAL